MTVCITAFLGQFGKFSTFTTSINCRVLGNMFGPYYAQQAEEAEDPLLRAQRVLDMGHVRKINAYLDRSVRAFGSPIATARVVSVQPLPGVSGLDDNSLVQVELDDLYLVDGQKRVKSCILRCADDPNWSETIPLHIVGTDDLRDKQQLFSSINSTAAKVSPSLNAIYDHSNALSAFITANCPADVMESEKATISKSSSKLVTPTIFKEALASHLRVSLKQLTPLSLEKLEASWDRWHPFMSELWRVYRTLTTSAGDLPSLRQTSILPHNVGFLAVVRLFPLLRDPAQLQALVHLEREGLTARASGLWDGRCIMLGNMKKSVETVSLTAAMLATQLDLELDDNLKLFL